MSLVNSLIKIDLADQRDVFLVCSFEPAKKLHVFLLDVNDCKAFSGYATDVDLRSQAATIHMPFSDFLSLTTKALTNNEAASDKFLYCLEKFCGNFIFRWKSVDLEETVISIGSIKVTQTDYGSVIKDVFLMLSKELSNLNTKVLNIEKDMSNVRKEKENAMALVTDTIDMKERVENELYSKFILVLNEKKKKIRELKRNNDIPLNSTLSKRPKIPKLKKVHQISDSSDEAASDGEKMNVAGPSTAKRNKSLLFFDDEDERPLLPSPSKRRNRHQNAVTKTTNVVVFQEQKSKEISHTAMESESEDELLLNL